MMSPRLSQLIHVLINVLAGFAMGWAGFRLFSMLVRTGTWRDVLNAATVALCCFGIGLRVGGSANRPTRRVRWDA